MHTILGAGGAIGTELARELLQYTNAIRIVSRKPEKVNETDQVIAADLNDKNEVFNSVQGSKVVYLTAGLRYRLKDWEDQWPRIMNNVIEACLHYRCKLVFFDNIYAYDANCIGHMTEETPVNPASKKGRVRAHVAALILDQIKAGTLQGMIVRAADFYGPRVKTSAVNQTVYDKLKKGQRAMWLGDPDKIHSLTFTPDAARGTALLGNTPSAFGQVWHLPTTEEKLTGREWIKLFALELQVLARITPVSKGMVSFLGLFNPMMRELREMMYQNEHDYFFDSSKFMKTFPGFRITEPREGVQQIIAADVFTS